MIKFETNDVWGFEWAFKGMRNPMNSWDKSDSNWLFQEIGKNDLTLAKKLINAGSEHRKFLRQIYVSVDITAPLYWWKEFDTYKIGTVANSCSTMHKIHEKEFTLEDFSCEHLIDEPFPVTDEYVETYLDCMTDTIKALNCAREKYLETKRDLYLEREKALNMNTSEPMADVKKLQEKQKLYWWQIIQLLPSSYNQTRTVTMTYENIYTMRQQRKGHKLDEWRIDFFNWSDELPHLKELFD